MKWCMQTRARSPPSNVKPLLAATQAGLDVHLRARREEDEQQGRCEGAVPTSRRGGGTRWRWRGAQERAARTCAHARAQAAGEFCHDPCASTVAAHERGSPAPHRAAPEAPLTPDRHRRTRTDHHHRDTPRHDANPRRRRRGPVKGGNPHRQTVHHRRVKDCHDWGASAVHASAPEHGHLNVHPKTRCWADLGSVCGRYHLLPCGDLMACGDLVACDDRWRPHGRRRLRGFRRPHGLGRAPSLWRAHGVRGPHGLRRPHGQWRPHGLRPRGS